MTALLAGYSHLSKLPTGPFPCLNAPFNDMRTLKFKGQPTNAFFATINQMFGDSSQLSCQ